MVQSLVIQLSFNSPEISILGPIKEQTIEKLNEVMPKSTTSMRSTRHAAPKFEYRSNPNHWYLKLDRQFCDDEGISYLMVLILDAVEVEGDWKLVTSISSTKPNGMGPKDVTENYIMFFNKFVGDDV